jgi:DNA-binding CsgD family transcriptional regulator
MLGVVSRVFEAAMSPESWPTALRAVVDANDLTGAACAVWNRRTAQIEWAALSSNYPADILVEYFRDYAVLDPYTPLLADSPCGDWLRLSECVSPEVLRRDEWYCGYLVKNGAVDVIGTRLFETGSRTFLFSIREGIGQKKVRPERLPALRRLMTPLTQAAQLTIELRRLRCMERIAGLVTEQLGAAVIVCDSGARILELDRAAERLLEAGEALTARDGRLSACRAFETGHLEALIATAAGLRGRVRGGRMPLGGVLGSAPLIATVTPLDTEYSRSGNRAVIVLISGGEVKAASEEQISELFRLSRAETRLAAALAQGRTLAEITADRGLKITTLRTQLSSILKKLGIHRQADLVRLLVGVSFAIEADPQLQVQSPLRHSKYRHFADEPPVAR